jgi:hypothetical protein
MEVECSRHWKMYQTARPKRQAAANVHVPAPVPGQSSKPATAKTAVTPTHPEGIIVEIIGITAQNQGRTCEEQTILGEVVEEDVIDCLCHVQDIMPLADGGPGREITALAVYWVTNGVDRCHVGILPHHMAKYAAQ